MTLFDVINKYKMTRTYCVCQYYGLKVFKLGIETYLIPPKRTKHHIRVYKLNVLFYTLAIYKYTYNSKI